MYWNDNETPLGYLITIRTYGTWLPGDERGSIDSHHNTYRGPRLPPNAGLELPSRNKLKSEPLIFNGIQRTAVYESVSKVCEHRSWLLRAINVRTNHAHTIVSIGAGKSSSALNAFKAYGTRKLRERGLWSFDHSLWPDKDSDRWLWTEVSPVNARNYVISGQGHDLRDFDNWGEGAGKM